MDRKCGVRTLGSRIWDLGGRRVLAKAPRRKSRIADFGLAIADLGFEGRG